ncbi:leucine-rich repeat domain-containing protein [Pseudobacteriovorax antillogorgiicola]|nr:leucine-rich repeat domain-containing protein [Pseudobacteriovorax antillogorgiicola]
MSLIHSVSSYGTEKAACPEGQSWNDTWKACLLTIPSCAEQEYLDQASMTCKAIRSYVDKESCQRQGLRFDQKSRNCQPLNFVDRCESSEHSYDFLRTMSIIVNSLQAKSCREAFEEIERTKSLKLNDPHFVVGSLEPLRYLPNLEYLDLSYQRLDHIDDLSELKRLKTVVITGNDIQDLSPIKGIRGLQLIDHSDEDHSAPADNSLVY